MKVYTSSVLLSKMLLLIDLSVDTILTQTAI